MSEKIAKVELNNFAAFEQLSLDFSPGINLIIGANGTGKTQLLKYIYAATSLEKAGEESNIQKAFASRIKNIYMDIEGLFSRLHINSSSNITDEYDFSLSIISSFSENSLDTIPHLIDSVLIGDIIVSLKAHHNTRIKNGEKLTEAEETQIQTLNKILTVYEYFQKNLLGKESLNKWHELKFNSVYIPSKEIISNASGFLSTVKRREMSFDASFVEILESAYLPKLLAPLDSELDKICNEIEEIIGGKVVIEGEKFFVKNQFQKLPMIMVAEGHRKLALIYILIQNGELSKDSIIIWDEPEANLNPKLQQEVVRIIMELARIGAQVFIATHSYFLLKEFDLSTTEQDNIQYITLYRDKDEHNKIKASVTNDYNKIENNPIDEVGMDQLDRKFRRARVIFNDDNNS